MDGGGQDGAPAPAAARQRLGLGLWPLRAFSRKPRPPLFVCTAGAQQCGNATAVMATRWIIVAVQCTVPCPAAAAAAAWPFFSLSGTAPAPALLAAEEKRHGGAEPMCGTAMSERDDWCSSSSYRPGRSGGRPSALRTGRPDIRTARRLFRRFPTSHSQPLFTRESLAPRGNQRLRYACQHRSLERTLLLFFIHSPLKSTRRREIESQPETASRLPVAAKQKPAAVPVLYALCRVHGPDAGFRTPVRRRPQVHCTNGMHVCVYTYTSCPIPPVASPNQTVEVVLSSLKAR